MTRIWKHQEAAIEWIELRLASGHKYAILNHGMGSGKTRTTLEWIGRHPEFSRIIVCCPKAVMPAWVKQAGLWLPSIRVAVLSKGSSKDKAKDVEQALADRSPVIIFVNYDSARRFNGL